MDLIDRYVYAVMRHVPSAQRAETEKEIRVMIDELVQEQMKAREDQIPDEAVVRSVLLSLGEPASLARQYNATPNYIIGPVLYDTYWLVLRIVLIAVGIGILIAQIIRLISGEPGLTWAAFGNLFGSVYQGLLSAFGIVTLVFLLIERFGLDDVKKEIRQKEEKWRLDDLPQVPGDKIRVKRGDPIVTIVFSLIFLAILNISPELFGYYEQTENGLNIIGFLGAGFTAMLLWVNVVILFEIALEALKIVYARWTWLILLSSIAQSTLSLIVWLNLVRHPEFINPSFIEKFNSFITGRNFAVNILWQQHLVTGLIVIIAFGFAVELITLIFKGYYLLCTRRSSD